jgi:lipoate-protein ligase A
LFFGLPLREFYVLLHSFVGEALKKNGFLPDIEKKEKKVSGYYKCFENPVSGDLFLPETGKIAGAAQKRINNGILIQGSVAIGRLGIDFAKFADAFAEVLAAKGDFAVEKYSPPVEIRAHALKLCEKYSSSDWNEKRKYERL